VAGNHHMVSLAFGNTCGHRTDTDFRHQLDADICMRRNIFQVVNQLRQIFDGINIVVWRR